jgi:hypothetical protein
VATYLPGNCGERGLKVTRIAMGSVGSDIEYADEITMLKAMEGRAVGDLRLARLPACVSPDALFRWTSASRGFRSEIVDASAELCAGGRTRSALRGSWQVFPS